MRLLDLRNWNTITVQEDDLDCLITAEYTEHVKGCPHCGFMLLDKHGKLPNLYMDIPQDGKHSFLVGIFPPAFIHPDITCCETLNTLANSRMEAELPILCPLHSRYFCVIQSENSIISNYINSIEF